jgi:hypothetical protein
MRQPRVIIRDRLHWLPRQMWGYPHDREVYEGLKSALTTLYGKKLWACLVGPARAAFREELPPRALSRRPCEGKEEASGPWAQGQCQPGGNLFLLVGRLTAGRRRPIFPA